MKLVEIPEGNMIWIRTSNCLQINCVVISSVMKAHFLVIFSEELFPRLAPRSRALFQKLSNSFSGVQKNTRSFTKLEVSLQMSQRPDKITYPKAEKSSLRAHIL